MKSWIAGVALVMLASAACGDQLVLGGQTKEGTFQGYENGRFFFANKRGRLMREQAIRVTKLVLSSPMRVVYVTKDGKAEEIADLTGYEKKAFTFDKKGQQVVVPQAKMKEIGRSEEGGEGGGDGGRYPVPEVDLDSFAGDNVTPAQQAALDRYKTAKKKFDDYVADSTALVKEMDAATGAKREALLNQLRQRKNEEQPLKKDLIAAYNALADLFPEPADEPAPKAEKGAKR